MLQRFITFSSLFVTLSLAACGGGDPDTDAHNQTSSSAAVPASDASQAPEPAPAPTPAPPPPRPPASVLHDGWLLSNALPQAGSSSAIGNGVEGLWVAPSGPSAGFGFIGADGRYLGFLAAPSTYPAVFEGALTLAATHWSFTPASRWSISDGANGYATSLQGSGDVMLRHRFQGSYTTGGAEGGIQRLVYDYAAANALAAAQADVAGDWSTAEIFLSIDARGSVTGHTRGVALGQCVLGGTVLHIEPATRKNMFAVTLTAAPRSTDGPALGAQACRIDSTQPLTGYTALTPDADALVTRRYALTLLARNGTRVLATEFDKDLSNVLLR